MKAVYCSSLIFYLSLLLSCGDNTTNAPSVTSNDHAELSTDSEPKAAEESGNSETANNIEENNTALDSPMDSDTNWHANQENNSIPPDPQQGLPSSTTASLDSDDNWSPDSTENSVIQNSEFNNQSSSQSNNDELPVDSDANWQLKNS